MRVLFLTQRYPPEMGTASDRVSDLAERLSSFGHEVTVLAPLPNHPQGQIYEGYRGRFLVREERHGVKLIRSWIYPNRKEGILPRLLNYFSFVFTSLVVSLVAVKRPDVIFVASPPLFLGISGLLLKWVWRTKMVFNVADLWPQSAVEMGVVKNRHFIKAASALEHALYRHSDLVTGQTQGIVTDIEKRTDTPVLLCTNGVDPSLAMVEVNRQETRRSLGIGEGDFVVGYAGLHGLAQGLVSLLTAAEQMQSEAVKLVFFGDGPQKKELVELANRRGLANVMFFPPQPKTRMPEIMNALDVSLVPLRRLELFRGALPGKMFESMMCGVPVIVSIEGEAKDLVERSRAGICVPPEDPQALINAILLLRDNPQLRQRMGQSGRQFVSAHYDRRVIARRVEAALSGLTACPGPNVSAVASGGN